MTGVVTFKEGGARSPLSELLVYHRHVLSIRTSITFLELATFDPKSNGSSGCNLLIFIYQIIHRHSNLAGHSGQT